MAGSAGGRHRMAALAQPRHHAGLALHLPAAKLKPLAAAEKLTASARSGQHRRRALQTTAGLTLRRLTRLALGRRSRGTPAALTSLTSRAAGARTFGRTLRAARGHGRTKFLLLEFTVVVLVEGQQRLRGIRDLVLIELAVLIDIQRRDDGRNHGAELAAPSAGLTGLARLTGSAGLRRHGLGRRRGWLRGCGGCRRNRILCEQSAGGSQRGEQ